MSNEDNKKGFLKSVLGKIKMHDAGEKRKKMDEPVAYKPSMVNYPSLYLNVAQAPELKGYDVDNDVTLVIKGKITSHSLNERKGGSRETWDVEIKKIGVAKS